MTPKQLLATAESARENAYAPYSDFLVGAALLCTDGTVYTGCNLENSAFSPSICAERVAFAKALSEGKRDFAAIAVVGAARESAPRSLSPCGVCLQVMREFCDPAAFLLYTREADGTILARPLSAYLPLAFVLENPT